MNTLVLGAGAWGTALAIHAARFGECTLWLRNAAQLADMQASRENTAYLPQHALPANLRLSHTALDDLPALCAAHDLIIIATPTAGVRAMLTRLRNCPQPVLWLSKGFEQPDGLLLHEVAQQVAPDLRCGVLSGPSFAQEVAQQQPTALVAASANAEVVARATEALHHGALRVYASTDVVGVEVGGAVKNVLAIATGLCDGLNLGLNARAALLTRGLAEISRLGAALGAQPDTFRGLSGLGDLVLTATGNLSRNRQVGLLLAQGQSCEQATQSLGHVAEGVLSAYTVAQRAQALGVEMPLTQCVVQLLQGQINAAQALELLLHRQAKTESATKPSASITPTHATKRERPLILASTSRYRRELLERLRLPFTVQAPQTDETPLADETPLELALRLARAKALAVAQLHPNAIVIGSDQVLDLNGQPMGKPLTHARAVAQLQAMRGQSLVFHTALCVMCLKTGFEQTLNVPTHTVFRDANDAEIERYLLAETPYDCAGSAKSEGLGIALLSRMHSDDPTAIIGLPLIATAALLRQAGITVL